MRAAIIVVVGLLLGIGVGMVLPESVLLVNLEDEKADGPTGEIWQCPMLHVKTDRPGDCPVCGMALEKVENAGSEIQLDDQQSAEIGLATAKATLRAMTKDIETVGIIDYNERRVKTISAWVAGRIDRLYADHTYTDVRQDGHVMLLYSPSLYAAQEELLVGGSTRLAARRKLALLGMRESQIEELERTGKAQEQMEIRSPISGKVIDLKVKEGDYVKEGTPLYTVADFSSFWLRFDAYEQDLPWIVVGQPVDITLDAVPGKSFPATVSFIEGIVDARTRTTKVRVTVDNSHGLLRPGMYAEVSIHAPIGADGAVIRPTLEGRYSCYMHPSVSEDEEGDCPICGMPLELVTHAHAAAKSADTAERVLAVPETAVLSTGERHLVYIETAHGVFEPREVKIGVRSGGYIHILHGIEPGTVVATKGNFLMDSQMQLTGRPSLLSPAGGESGGGHKH